MVLNNAGVATSQTIAEGSIEDDEWVTDVNFGGVVHGTRAFLPILERQGSGVIVNVSSVFGLVGIPGQSAYCASKFAVRGFTESLRRELMLAGSGVSACVVHPGGVRTNVARNARYHSDPMGRGLTREQAVAQFDAIALTTPERAAEIIHRGVASGARTGARRSRCVSLRPARPGDARPRRGHPAEARAAASPAAPRLGWGG